MDNFDIGIIGAGVAGVFATLKISEEHKDIKTIVFDLGRPPMKRRRQLEGWLGCLPNSDGKLYLSDLNKIENLVGSDKTNNAFKYFTELLSNINTFKVVKDKLPSVSVDKKIKKNNFEISGNDYIQMYPKDIHDLSKYISNKIELSNNITFNFDNEVINIYKQGELFIVSTDDKEYSCNKLIISVGRSGWRWANKLFSDFGIIDNNDIAKYGIRVEMNSALLKDFNKSSCTIKKDNIEIGPFCWGGTVIPEDHVELAISAFRSNENRWKSDKVSFNIIGDIHYKDNGFEQVDRIGNLTFVLSNDRILREKVALIMSGKSKISIIPEYNWLNNTLTDISNIIPELLTKAYFHVPTILPLCSKINLGNNFESEVEKMFVIGESAGVSGILSAAMMGIIVSDHINI
jgi:uncharacterized protein